MSEEPLTKKFDSGAQRSADAEHLDFLSIHPIALIALARTCAEGAKKYGAHNYALGMPATDALNHVLRHVVLWLAGDREEPHLPHAMWGLMTAIAMDTLHPELSAQHLRGPGCTVTPAMKKCLDDAKPERQRKREAGEFDHLGEWKLEKVPEIKRILEQRSASVR